MRTTLDLDDNVIQAAKELAALEGKTIGQVVSELLRKALEPAPSTLRVRNGVPLLSRRPGAPVMTMDFVNRIRDDDA